jgi:O-antigen ligase
VAGIGIYGYLWRVDSLTIPAEGVLRVRAFYGSPNNLALYLERTLAVCSALFLFETSVWRRWLALLLAGPQAVALLLTFSKGTFVLGAPALIFTLAVVGWTFLWRQGRSRCLLWWLALAGGAGLLVLTPVSGAERFRSLLDFGQGTSFLRINLWRSAWQMAFDHPLFGVGPDQFLYHFRSGYILPAAWREPDLNHPHNWLLDWWTRLGLPGLALGFGWWLTLIRQGVHWAWTEVNSPSDNALSVLRIGVLAALASSLTHGLIDQSYALPDLMLTWVLCAALLRRPCREMLLEQGY